MNVIAEVSRFCSEVDGDFPVQRKRLKKDEKRR